MGDRALWDFCQAVREVADAFRHNRDSVEAPSFHTPRCPIVAMYGGALKTLNLCSVMPRAAKASREVLPIIGVEIPHGRDGMKNSPTGEVNARSFGVHLSSNIEFFFFLLCI